MIYEMRVYHCLPGRLPALLKRFELFGPPATLFFGGTGEELRKARLVGFQKPEQFLDTLARAGL